MVVGDIAVPADKIGCVSPIKSETIGTKSFTLPYEGKILVVDRGQCTFEQKALFAQEGGAIGIIVVNTAVRCCFLNITCS